MPVRTGKAVRMDSETAWQLAELRLRSNALSTFVAAYADDADRAREARRLGDRVFTLGPDDLAEADLIVATLAEWFREVPDDVPRPPWCRPAAADRMVRDHLKDVLREHASYDEREARDRPGFLLDYYLGKVLRHPAASPQLCEDARYVHGRATMASDFGLRAAAEREEQRLSDYLADLESAEYS
jgi:hypothetical protein